MQRRAQHKTQTLLQSSRQAILPQTGAKKRKKKKKKEKKRKKKKAETGFIPVSAFLFLYSSKQTVLPSS